MTRHVLVLTPTLGFGELIRQFLEDTGGFSPALESDPSQALERARRQNFDLTILDADFDAQGLPKLVAALRETNPEMGLIVIPAEDRPDEPVLDELGAEHVLPSPFYLPDLMSALESLFGDIVPREVRTLKGAEAGRPPRKPQSEAPHQAPEWLGDVSLAAQYLTRLSLESSSQAALITRGRDVWAYAGELPQPAANELAGELASHWEGAGADLARFVHLDATQGDYMLYATSLGGDYVLAMVFDAEMPFSKMRAQAGEMAGALAVAPKMEMAAGQHEEPQAARMEAEQPPINRDDEPRHIGDFEPELPRAQLPEVPPASVPAEGEARVVTPSRAPQAAVPDANSLRYAYAMIPRLPSHRLEGDLAEKLALWLPQLCLAFGWRLESLNLQPDFLQWMVSMPADTSPESVANTLDKYLSERIFDEFPRLGRDNPSGKFWAPDFLIVNGNNPNDQLISDFIQQTRSRQGVPRNG